jgi:hypothetical protein
MVFVCVIERERVRVCVCAWVCMDSELDMVHKVTAPHQFALLPSHKPPILPAAAAAASSVERETVYVATTPSVKVTGASCARVHPHGACRTPPPPYPNPAYTAA